jgi:hypothetical protein
MGHKIQIHPPKEVLSFFKYVLLLENRIPAGQLHAICQVSGQDHLQ